jgi:parvulin-like peptidyl-prolyl isomerase
MLSYCTELNGLMGCYYKEKSMKRLLWILPALICCLGVAETKTVDRILAQVNDDIITLSDRNQKVAEYDLEQKYSGEELTRMRLKEEKQALEELIQEKLLDQKAKEFPAPADLDSRVAAQIQQIMKINNLKTTEELDKALSTTGSNLREFRDRTRRRIQREDIIHSFVYSRISLTNQEIEKFYKDHIEDFSIPEEVTLSEIDINGKNSMQEAESRAKDIYSRLLKGESFAVLASQFSNGLNTSTYQVAKLNSDTIKTIAGLKDGDFSKPQKLKDIYVIYRVDARKPTTVRPLEEVKNSIQQQLWDQKFNPELDRFLAQLKEDAYIQFYTEMK